MGHGGNRRLGKGWRCTNCGQTGHNRASCDAPRIPPPSERTLEQDLALLSDWEREVLGHILAWKGKLIDLSERLGKCPSYCGTAKASIVRRVGEDSALAHALELRDEGLTERDLIRCGRCSLRGHEEKDCDLRPIYDIARSQRAGYTPEAG